MTTFILSLIVGSVRQSFEIKCSALPLTPLPHCIRLKEAETKKKKMFELKSSAKKEQKKYYEMVLKKLEDFVALEKHTKGLEEEAEM